MGNMDIILLVIIVSTLVVGFFWGAIRSLMLLAAWSLAFVAGSYLKLELGSYLASQWDNYVATFSEMAAFGLIFIGLLVAAPIIIILITRGSQRLTRSQVLDDLIGAIFGALVAVLSIAGLMIVMSTFYGTDPGLVVNAIGGPEWTAQLYESLVNSNVGSAIAENVVPILGTILGPILPESVREVMG
ncbi:MAG: CvpA family protein [Chloroflexota bacterium]